MEIKSVKLVTFSPTGNSKKIAETVAKATQLPTENLDITKPPQFTKIKEFNDELTIIASPVYLGRIPHAAATRIRWLKGNNTPAVLIVTYGNRAYEDALLELSDIVSEVGFKPIAAAAFIGEHSWSMIETPTAHGRPDEKDHEKAELFGNSILEKCTKAGSIEKLPIVSVPGDNPYSQSLRGGLRRYHLTELMSPYTNMESCSRCGSCEEACPTNAVKLKSVFSNPSPMASLSAQIVSTNADDCVWCAACVKACPTGARVRRPRMMRGSKGLSEENSDRKEPVTFI